MNKKFITLAMLTSALIAGLVVIFVLSFQLTRHILVKENEALAQSVAQSILPALLANDTQQIEAMIKALESHPELQKVELIGVDGAPIASYIRSGQHLNPLSSASELVSVVDDPEQVHVMAPITFDHSILANLHLVVNLWVIYFRILTWLGVALIASSAVYVCFKQLRIKIHFEKAAGDGGSDPRPFDVHAAIDQALSEANISLQYQPIRRLSDGGLFGMEVVACWAHPSGRTLHISPTDFVSLAEKAHVSLPFDTWLLTTACAKAATWQDQYGPLILTIDVTEAQFNDPAFPQKVRDICEATQYPYQLLELEVNEAIMSDQAEAALKTLQEFAQQGLSVTMDGFGLMRSSPQLLKTLPVHKVKLSDRLIKNMMNDAQIDQLVADTIAQALSCGVQVMSDGIESPQQRYELQRMGCVLGQGAYFDQALPANEFETLLIARPFEGSGRDLSGKNHQLQAAAACSICAAA